VALFDDDEEEDEKGNVERQRPRSPSEVLPRRRRGVSPSRSVDLAIADRSDVVGEQSSSQSNDRRGWTFPRKTPTDEDGDDDDDDDDDGVTTPYPHPSGSSPPPSSPSADAP
jgi:hypothetical protein